MNAPAELRPGSLVEAQGKAYRMEVLRGQELAALLPLFHDAFRGRTFSVEWLTKKYACASGGLAGFACVALTEDGEPAGSVGVLPWPVQFQARTETAGQMVDVATGNAHRGRGLFVACAELARQVCEDAGVDFLFGFPNEAAYPIWINKLGYVHCDDMVEHRLAVRTVWVERVAKRARLASAYERYVERTLRRFATRDGGLENSLLREGFAAIARDPAFFRYKAAFSGSEVADLAGGRVWLNVQHGLLIGDLEAASPQDADATVSALVALARRLGLHQVLFQASKETRFTDLLAPRFQRVPGLPVIYRGLSARIPRERLRFTFGDFDNF